MRLEKSLSYFVRLFRKFLARAAGFIEHSILAKPTSSLQQRNIQE